MEPMVQQMAKDASESGDYYKFGFVFLLFVVWKLVEEVLRFRGQKKYEKENQTNINGPSKFRCKWTVDDHNWLSEIRDLVKDRHSLFNKLDKFLDRENSK